MPICSDCLHYKDDVSGEGKCKKDTPKAHFTNDPSFQGVRRTNGWSKTKGVNTSCSNFEVIP